MPKLFKLIACEIYVREICWAISQSSNVIDPQFLSLELHDSPRKGTSKLQKAINKINLPYCDAILIGYGLCSGLIEGIKANSIPLVIPKVHDCLGLIYGKPLEFESWRKEHPATFFFTPGWIEAPFRKGTLSTDLFETLPVQISWSVYSRWIKLYGHAKAQELLNKITNLMLANYKQIAWIEWEGIFQEDLFCSSIKSFCKNKGWEFIKLKGQPTMILDWVNGRWDSSAFLIVPPKCKVRFTYDENLIEAIP